MDYSFCLPWKSFIAHVKVISQWHVSEGNICCSWRLSFRKNYTLYGNNFVPRILLTQAAVGLLDKLDGIRLNKKKESAPQRMEDYLQLPDDYETRTSQPGKKRVMWMSLYCMIGSVLHELHMILCIHIWSLPKLSSHSPKVFSDILDIAGAIFMLNGCPLWLFSQQHFCIHRRMFQRLCLFFSRNRSQVRLCLFHLV